MKVLNKEIFDIHASFCRTIANPQRLIIITGLGKREMTVGEIAELLELPLANTSQHLKALRDRDIVKTRKQGQKIFYSLNDPNLVEACNAIRRIILDLYKRKGQLIGGQTDIQHLISE